MPTKVELQELNLSTVLHGDNTHDWERLHVTVAMEWTLPQSCSWAVSVQAVDLHGRVVENHDSLLHRLGCALLADADTYAVCHLEV